MILDVTGCHSAMADQSAVALLKIKMFHAGMYLAKPIPGQ